jgi:hypothetical protein
VASFDAKSSFPSLVLSDSHSVLSSSDTTTGQSAVALTEGSEAIDVRVTVLARGVKYMDDE